ncbi:MAG: hypothetical protein C0425_00265 [Chlorobiaceae bacterium]|nr:hypothetical protein [Chlorobiaceae bacterium]MBA4308757.1 hypothetical protein [Chlorobiaceae bacterium]
MIQVIINPVSGKGKVKKQLPNVLKILRSNGIEDNAIFISPKPGDINKHVSKLPNDTKLMVVGGDGTFNEIVNGLRSDQTITLLPIPLGSGNDFARELGFPLNYDYQRLIVKYINNHYETKFVDIGELHLHLEDSQKIENVKFLTNCGIGFDAKVAAFGQKIKYFRGILLYLIAVVKTLAKYKNFEVKIESENFSSSGEKLLIAIGNGKTSGGGFRLCPFAKIDDGILDITIAEGMKIPEILRVLPKAINGSHIHEKKITTHQFTKLNIFPKSKLYIHTDGEVTIGTYSKIEINIIPKRLEVPIL